MGAGLGNEEDTLHCTLYIDPAQADASSALTRMALLALLKKSKATLAAGGAAGAVVVGGRSVTWSGDGQFGTGGYIAGETERTFSI